MTLALIQFPLPTGAWGGVVVKALRYYSDGPGIDSGWCPGIFSDVFPSDPTMALGSTQTLVKMSTRNIPGGKGGQCVMLTNSPPSRAERHEIWKPKPAGTLWATPGLLRDSFYLHPRNERQSVIQTK
jgi:hypothetical protein